MPYIRREINYVYYMLSIALCFGISYIFGMILKDSFVSNIIDVGGQPSFTILAESLILYAFMYVFWDILLFFCLLNMVSVLISKLLGLNIGRMVWVTLLSTVLAYVTFHLIMYLWFVVGDPLGIKDVSLLSYLYAIFSNSVLSQPINLSELDSSSLNALASAIFDLVFGFYYKTYFTTDPSFVNYIVIYFLMKGVVTDLPFQMAGIAFNPYHYEILFVLGLFIIFFTIFYFVFYDVCACITNKEVEEVVQKKQKEFFGEDIPDKTTIGEFVVSKKEIQSLKRISKIART